MSLSGGQRQRLSLARAILAAPRILVLDDTLSALDVHTEAVVEEALRRVLHAVTGIVVAHRASTVLLADKVALLGWRRHHPHRHARRIARQRPAIPLPAGRRRRTRRRLRARLRLAGRRGPQPARPGLRGAGGAGTRTSSSRRFVDLGGRAPMTATDIDRGAVRFDEDQTDDLPIDENLPRRREARALLGSLLRPYRATVALLALVVVVENAARLSVPLLVQRGIDHGIPPIIDGGSAHKLMIVVGHAGRGGAGAGHQPDVLPAALRPHRPEGAAGVAAPGVPALPATRHQVPRPLHLGPGGEPVHQRRRGHPGHAGDRLRQPDHRRAHTDRHVHSACDAGCSARPDVPGRLPDPGGAGLVVPQRVGQDLSQGAGERRAGDRAVRRDDDRVSRRCRPTGASRAIRRSSRTSPTTTARSTRRPSGCSRSSCPA